MNIKYKELNIALTCRCGINEGLNRLLLNKSDFLLIVFLRLFGTRDD